MKDRVEDILNGNPIRETFVEPVYIDQIGQWVDGYEIEAIKPTEKQLEDRVFPISVRYFPHVEVVSATINLSKDRDNDDINGTCM